MTIRQLFLGSIIFMPSLGLCATGDEGALQDASSVLAQIQEEHSLLSDNLTAQAKFLVDLQKYRQAQRAMPPKQAARQWMELYDRALVIQEAAQPGDVDSIDLVTGRPADVWSALASLPSPPSWPELRKIASDKVKADPHNTRKLALCLLMEVLSHDPKAIDQSMAKLKTSISSLPSDERGYASGLLEQLGHVLVKQRGTPDQIVQDLVEKFDQYTPGEYVAPIEVPDLVNLVGVEKAEDVLRRAIHSNAPLGEVAGDETAKLAREIALKHVSEMRAPQWMLAYSVEAAPLYEAMNDRFRASIQKDKEVASREDYSGKKTATEYYLLHCISTADQEKAEATLKELNGNEELSLPANAVTALQKAHQNEALATFLGKVLKRNPEFQGWDLYIEQSAYVGQANAALELLDTQLARKDISSTIRQSLEQKRIAALLSSNRVEEAISSMQRFLERTPEVSDNQLKARLAAAIRLAQIGQLIDRPQLSHQALAYIEVAVKLDANDPKYDRDAAVTAAEKTYRLLHEPVRAQALAISELKRKSAVSVNSEEYGVIYPDRVHFAALVELVGIYAAEDRPQDAVTLLDGATQWINNDLRPIISEKDSVGVPLGFSAAKALAATSRTTEAVRILEKLMESLPGYDPAYRLYIDLVGSGAATKLEELADRDQFEERPLIWKAQLLWDSGNKEFAEQIVRKAIAIDPSDGDEPKGDRLRAYDLLASILDAKLDTAGADTYHHAVNAIRTSEKADDYYSAGLYNKAFDLYRQALAQFSNAYCVQSRLAIQLTKLGQFNEAIQHYKQAYELMPESFGRVESHCFGCESVFKDATAQTVAEQVFMDALNHDAKKPQIHYLMGYLREEQHRYAEALKLYREAVTLDPTYLNAWKHLDAMSEHTYVTENERDDARFKLLSLDPNQRHVKVAMREVGDYARLWDVVGAAEAQPDHDTPLYLLKGRADKIAASIQKLPPTLQKQLRLYQALIAKQQRRARPDVGLMIIGNDVIRYCVRLTGGQQADAY